MFSPIDWLVVGIYIGGTTWIGHKLKGQQETPHDFFLGGRRIPWFAVSASIIATTISAVTFIGVPAFIYAAGGDFTYLQLAIGGIIAKLLIARLLIPRYYEQEFYSPYDYIGQRLGATAGRLTAMMFILGGILGQSVRVYATALVLELLTGWTMGLSILIIAVFAILWTWMGGVAAVIWTDLVQFLVLVVGGVAALTFMVTSLPDGFATLWELGRQNNKLTVLNLSMDPRVAFTFWAALIALPFQGIAVYGADHLFTQRLLCCKNSDEARKALLWSILGECIPALMLIVGLGLFAFYSLNPLDSSLAALVAEKGDRIFPLFIINEMPTGLKGLIIAGILSAAISSLDSILAALSQISLTMFYRPFVNPGKEEAHYLAVSRLLVIAWGLVLAAIAWQFTKSGGDIITLAFSMTTYTLGPMLGLFLASLISHRITVNGFTVAVAMSMAIILLINQPQLMNPVLATNFSAPLLAWPWLFPIGALVCLLLCLRPQQQ